MQQLLGCRCSSCAITRLWRQWDGEGKAKAQCGCSIPHRIHPAAARLASISAPPIPTLCTLQDNLESQTYEVFEKDTTKYVQYEEAVYRALRDGAARPPGAVSQADWERVGSLFSSLRHLLEVLQLE